ncbi:MAG: hypothetical protein P4N59_18250 [Negativicutes bacterium]|nr:hypothetical protein [Negativicutes bacterium]
MLTKRMFFVVLMLFPLLLFAGWTQAAEQENAQNFPGMVQELQDMMELYDPAMGDILKASLHHRIRQQFRDVITRFPQEAATVSPKEITRGNPYFGLESINEVTIGDVTHRLVRFESKVIEQGSGTSIYVLSRDRLGNFTVQEFRGTGFLIYRPFGTQLAYCDFFYSGEDWYILKIDKFQGAEGHREVNFDTYRLQDNRWVEMKNAFREPLPFGTIRKIGEWDLMNGPIVAYSSSRTYLRDDYAIAVSGSAVTVAALKNGQPVGTLRLVFRDDGWVADE